MFSTNEITDWILSSLNIDAGDTISPLKLQKLLYYCQAWHLTIFKTPIFSEPIEAWAHGPVVPSQYYRFASLSRLDTIDVRNIKLNPAKVTEDTNMLLSEVMDIYGERSAKYLENLTHNETPWKDARGKLEPWARSNAQITYQSMIDYYSQFKIDGE